MKKSSRRMFLQGAAGASLAIPFLPSLVSKAYGQDGPGDTAPRFVGVASIYGTFRRNWEVDMDGETQLDATVWRKPLADVSGPLSLTLGDRFDAIRSKMSVFMGLDGTSGGGHNFSFPFSGATHTGGSDQYGTAPFFPYSLDTTLERAPEFYGDAPPPMPVLRSAPAHRGDPLLNISWWTDESGSVTYPYERNAATLFSTIFREGEPMADPNALRIQALDRVLEDYRRVAGHRRLSRVDRQRLENYGDLVQELSGRLGRTVTVSCDGPTQRPQEGMPLSVVYSNHIDIMVAALACGATRIGMMWIPDHDENDSSQSIYHGHSHGTDTGGGAGTSSEAQEFMLSANQWVADRVSELMLKMDGVSLGDETLLDRSAVLWSNELGGAEHHQNMGTPVVVAGGAGGRLRQGHVYDFRHRPRKLWANRNDFPPLGRPYNQLLVSLLQAMGLPRASYEHQGAGFGDYQLLTHRYTDDAYTPFVGREGEALPDFLMT